jgi:hypothetical protein
MTDDPRLWTYAVTLTRSLDDAQSAAEARKMVREHNALHHYSPTITVRRERWKDREPDDEAVAEPGETAVRGVRSAIHRDPVLRSQSAVTGQGHGGSDVRDPRGP